MSGMEFGQRRLQPERGGSGTVDCGSATARGSRPSNQDRCAVSPRWAIVSDGVGGHAGGDVAAELTVEVVVATLRRAADGTVAAGADPVTDGVDERLLQRAVWAANDTVRGRRQADPALAAMGATLTFAVAVSVGPDQSRWLVASVGDSPAWLVTGAGVTPLTEDHTLAVELVRTGAITPEQAASHPARHVIVRSIGHEEHVVADTRAVTLRPGDALVIASDGLTEALDAAGLHRLSDGDAGHVARRLVDAALRAGATDNVTVAVVRHMASSGGASRSRRG